MIREIIRDPIFLSIKSTEAVREDLSVADDLMDTLKANSDRCVGMAANMIGVSKRIIVVANGNDIMLMINPVITGRSKKEYTTEEGCLSLNGTRPVTRSFSIEVEYLDRRFKKQKRSFKGDIAEIIQHEADHLEGILI